MNSPALSCSLVLQSRFWQRRSGAKMLRVEGSARCGGVPQGSGACQGQGNRKGRRGAGRCWQARDARAGSTIQARTSRRGGRRPVAKRTPAGPHKARAGSGLHLAVFLCASFYTGGSGRNAAATRPANDAFIQTKWAAPRRNRSSSRRRRRSGIFGSSSSGKGAVGSSARCMNC